MAKFGFIGTGNMAGAIIKAISSTGISDMLLADKFTEKAQELAHITGGKVSDNKKIAEYSDVIFFGVKPQMLKGMIEEIAPVLNERKSEFVIVSMAAGVSIQSIEEMLGKKHPVIRIMPNTPVEVNKGVILYSTNEMVTEDQEALFNDAMKNAGLIDKIDQKFIDAASAISGCGPAFCYMFMEALSDGGVLSGLPRDKALLYAARTLSGAAELLEKSGKHPGLLKDNVCSPGGSTIEGVKKLENNGFRASVIEAVEASYKRTLELGK